MDFVINRVQPHLVINECSMNLGLTTFFGLGCIPYVSIIGVIKKGML